MIILTILAATAARSAARATAVVAGGVWFLTLLWFTAILANLSAFHSVWRLLLACLISAIPAVWFHGYLYLQKRRTTAAWQSPPPEPEPEYASPPPPPPPPPPPAAVFPLLRLRGPFTRAEAIAAFRRRSMELHPDHGGNAALFRMLLAERKRAMELPP
jgi:hypothetical protein